MFVHIFHLAKNHRYSTIIRVAVSVLISLSVMENSISIHRHVSVNVPTNQKNVHTHKSSIPAAVHVSARNRNVGHHGYTTITLVNVDVLMS